MFGPYRLGPLLGRGGMGEVHRAVDTTQGDRPVALKVLPPHLSGDAGYRERFRRECRSAGRLRNPHIVTVHRYGEIDGRLFLDMQLVDGRDLAAELMRSGPLPAGRALGIVAQIAHALDAAHAGGVVHRDVKPSNVLLADPGRADFVLLTDFGIAGATGEAGGDGTVEYLAPERLLGMPGDARVDVYALACVLHELLTGQRAFPGADFAAQVHGHLYLPPPRPSTMVAGLPAGFDGVVAQGMAKDPAQRFGTAGELVAAAGAAMAPPTVPATGLSRRRLAVAAGVVVALGAAGTAAVVFRSGSGTRSPGAGVVGPAPASVITERALGVRSTDIHPFRVSRAGSRPVIVVGAVDNAVHVYDVAQDRDVISPLRYFQKERVTTADVGGRAVLVDGYSAASIALSDMTTGQPFGRPLEGPARRAEQVLPAVIDGRPAVAAIGSSDDPTLWRWDLVSGAPIGDPVRLGPEEVDYGSEIGTAVVGGRSVIWVNAGGIGLIVRDLATGEKIATAPVIYGTVADVDGQAVVVSASFDGIHVDDLRTGASVRVLAMDKSSQAATTIAIAVVAGRPVVITDSAPAAMLVYDLRTGQQLGAPLTGHQADVTQVGVADLAGRPILVSAARDNAIRVWDLAVRAATG